jgi:hypothetical protein
VILSKYRVGLGGLLLGERDDDTGASWVVQDLEGWLNTTSTGTTTQRSSARGGWRNRAYLAAKGYTLVGSVYTDKGDVPDLLDELLAAIPLDVPEALTVYGVHANQDRLTYVRQEGEAATNIISPYEADFSIGLVAPDPLKYSSDEHVESTGLPVSTGGLAVPFSVPFSIDSLVISGVMSVGNVGNFPTAPRLIIYGPVEEPRVTHLESSKTIQVNMDLGVGEWLDIDLDRHTAYLNGTASRRGYISGQWWTLAKGNNTIAFNSPNYTADALAQVVWRDAWK